MADGIHIGVELGGTKVVVGSAGDGSDLLGRDRIPTTEPAVTLGAVRASIERLAGGARILGVGIGSFGPLDLRRSSEAFGTIVRTPKPHWSGVDLVAGILGGRDVPVGIDTDVNAALLAEHRHGAATADVAAYLTVGTGIGGGVIDRGRLLHGANHPEIGHVVVERHPDDPFGGACPYHGDCLEGMASGTALRGRFGAPADALAPAERTFARDLAAFYVAQGLVSMCAVVPVDVVVIGGGVSHLDGFHAAVTDHLAAIAGGYPPVPFSEGGPLVVPPGLGDDAGVVGAIELARDAATG